MSGNKYQPKHTPGPWVRTGFIGSAHGISSASTWNHSRETRHTIADVWSLENARLVALAPELLDMVKELSDLVQGVLVDDEPPTAPVAQMVSSARALIARAEGSR